MRGNLVPMVQSSGLGSIARHGGKYGVTRSGRAGQSLNIRQKLGDPPSPRLRMGTVMGYTVCIRYFSVSELIRMCQSYNSLRTRFHWVRIKSTKRNLFGIK